MPSRVSELIPMEDLTSVGDCPRTHVALDVQDPEDGSDKGSTKRLVGVVIGRSSSDIPTILVQHRDGHTMDIIESSIVRGWWAPMGYEGEHNG